ncbi:hypothetical protein Q9966_007221 [Columba livia]|nr:hypothetical protein Q9966_007221 [Columba livia]
MWWINTKSGVMPALPSIVFSGEMGRVFTNWFCPPPAYEEELSDTRAEVQFLRFCNINLIIGVWKVNYAWNRLCISFLYVALAALIRYQCIWTCGTGLPCVRGWSLPDPPVPVICNAGTLSQTSRIDDNEPKAVTKPSSACDEVSVQSAIGSSSWKRMVYILPRNAQATLNGLARLDLLTGHDVSDVKATSFLSTAVLHLKMKEESGISVAILSFAIFISDKRQN